MKLEIRTIQAEDTIDLRHRVMWPDLPRDHVVVQGDADATHFGAFCDGNLVGVGSFFPGDEGVRLRKLAVAPEFQGHGVARALLQSALVQLRAQGCGQIWCHARVSAAEFYRRVGFDLEADVFQKRGLDYVIARLEVCPA